MAQLLHPGVFIEEFTPASPIVGVSTSVAAFIGVTQSGPIMDPQEITSWDEFVATFGGPLDETYANGDKAYLTASVKGFFVNGGTTCYIVRTSSAVNASGELVTRNAPNDPVIIATAQREGATANGITVTVADRSVVEDVLAAQLNLAEGTTPIGAVPDARTLTVGATGAFQPGDDVAVSKNGLATLRRVVESVDATTLTLTAPLGPGNYANGAVRIANLDETTGRIRVDLPAVPLRRFLLPGTIVEIDVGNANAEFGVVATVTNDSFTLRSKLTKQHVTTAPIAITSREFDLHIADPATGTVEDFTGLSMDSGHPKWWHRIDSAIVRLAAPALPPGGAITDPRPSLAAPVVLANGTDDDRGQSWTDLIADPTDVLATLAPFDRVSIVAIPGATTAAAHAALVAHCELLGDRVAILDPIRGSEPSDAVAQAAGATGDNRGFATLYYPWIQIVNPATKLLESWPPSGHLAGIYARTDEQDGVHKAPANTNIRGALGLERRLTDADQDGLNDFGVSALRIPPGGGAPVVWGARTTTIQNRNWQYVNIRRLFNYLEESIADGIRWAVFEPNDRSLWRGLERSIGAFLVEEWRKGALFGDRREEAFYVRIDDALNPPSTRATGRLYIEIGVQPTYPAEFLVVRIGIWDGGSEASES
ncbi:phage tail sheath subtilisin-like domain-containing protein [Agromyces bracchium]|uniref:Phage tail sheath family protein n=1 Tax=Agromyces bracchium TaxID=88376 RepID=A0A6I3MJ83_9MICO|nr:phage tail sheath subtilisin-like domain-containing protein [Agromyces bracchium]MTH70313.1 phage tail sheath family protein [Agromyces bracchium]